MPSDPPSSDEPRDVSSRRDLLGRLQRLARWRQPPPGVRATLLVVAAVGVAVGVVWSLDALDVDWADLRLLPLLAAALLASPATIICNALELRVMTAIVTPDDRRMPVGTALRATVVATAANLLPIPGGALVRIAAVRGEGAGTGAATLVNLVGAGAWVAAGLLLATVAAAPIAPLGAVALAGALGLAGVVTVTAIVHRLARRRRTLAHTVALLVVETATALVHGLRLWLVLVALGIDVAIGQGFVLGAAAPLAAAAGIFPSGLGLAEALTAVIAPLVALPAAAGFAATGLARVVGLVVTGVLALTFGLDDLRRRARRIHEVAEQADPDDASQLGGVRSEATDDNTPTDTATGDHAPGAGAGGGRASEAARAQRDRRERRVRRR